MAGSILCRKKKQLLLFKIMLLLTGRKEALIVVLAFGLGGSVSCSHVMFYDAVCLK